MRFTRAVLNRLCLALGTALLVASAPAALAQNFAQPKVIPTGNWPAAVYSADVNADGFPDLIYIDQGPTPAASTTHVLLNDGHGNFSVSATLSTAGNSIAIGDFDGDGKADIGWLSATTSTAGGVTSNAISLSVASGKGDGTFAAASTHTFTSTLYAKPMEFHFLLAGRLHPGGGLDLLGGDTGNGIVVDFFYSSSNPVVITEQIVTPPDGVGPMVIADLNGDGANDLTVNSLSAFTAQTLVGFIGGGFANGGINHLPPTFTRFSGASGVHSLLIQDVNGDGRPDLIAEGANGRIDVFPGNGDATFSTTSIGGSLTADGTTGNGGHLIGSNGFNNPNGPQVYASTPIGISGILSGLNAVNGAYAFSTNGIYNIGPGRTSFALADFNNDGRPDIAVDSPEGIAIIFSNTDGSFTTSPTGGLASHTFSRAFAAGQPALSAAVGTFTSSGLKDIVVSTGATQAQLLINNTSSTNVTFQYSGFPNAPTPTSTQTGSPNFFSLVSIGDLNGDGNLDIALTQDGVSWPVPGSGVSGLNVQYGNGDGTFGPLSPVVQPLTTLYGTSVVADMDGDGISDIVNADPYSLNLLSGQKGSGFNYTAADLDGNVPGIGDLDQDQHCVLTVGDLNNDGKPDVVWQREGRLNVELNQGGGTFNFIGHIATYPQLSLTFGGPAPGFGNVPTAIGGIVIADLDGDGNADVIVTYDNLTADHMHPSPAAPNHIYIWYGDGTGNFPVNAAHPVNPVILVPSRNFYQVAVADLNRDGKPDLILSDGYMLSILYGLASGGFGPENHLLAGQGLNTITVADLNGDGKPDLVIANGGTVFGNPVANMGAPGVNPDVNTGGVTVLINQASAVLQQAVGQLTASPEPSIFGSPFALTVALTPAGGGTLIPTGTVSFTVDGVLAGSATLSSGSATLNVPSAIYATLSVGSHVLAAQYPGDSNFAAAQITGTHVVSAAAINTLTASPEPSTYGSAFTITATIPSIGTTPGTYTFAIDGSPIGTVTNSVSTATIIGPLTLAVGTHSLLVTWKATNSGLSLQVTGTHAVTQATTTLSLLLCVDAPGSNFPCANPLTNTPLVSPVTMFYGQTLDGTAIESSTILTGTINFLANNVIFCTINANLQGGANACPPNAGNFAAGSYVVDATYAGDANNTAAISNSITVTVFKDLTAATTTASVATAVFGTPVTFTGQVTGNFAVPVGPIVFFDGTTQIGTGTLDPTGKATFTTSTLAVGTHAVSITYAGNSNFNPTASPAVTVVITPLYTGPASFLLTVTPSPLTLGVGRTGVLLVTVTPVNGFSAPVALTCSGLPVETACTFLAASIPVGGGSTTLQLATSAPHDCGDPGHPYFLGANVSGPGKAFYAGLLLIAGLAGARRKLRTRLSGTLLLLAFALIGLSALSGCSHCTDLGTRPGNYTFTVTGTAAFESQYQTIPLTMTIP